MLRIKWTLQRCHEVPSHSFRTADLDARVGVGDAERGPPHAPRFELAVK